MSVCGGRCSSAATALAWVSSVVCSKMVRNGTSIPSCCEIRERIWIVVSEWPPRSKKSSCIPMWSTFNTSCQIVARLVSISVRGATYCFFFSAVKSSSGGAISRASGRAPFPFTDVEAGSRISNTPSHLQRPMSPVRYSFPFCSVAYGSFTNGSAESDPLLTCPYPTKIPPNAILPLQPTGTSLSSWSSRYTVVPLIGFPTPTSSLPSRPPPFVSRASHCRSVRWNPMPHAANQPACCHHSTLRNHRPPYRQAAFPNGGARPWPPILPPTGPGHWGGVPLRNPIHGPSPLPA